MLKSYHIQDLAPHLKNKVFIIRFHLLTRLTLFAIYHGFDAAGVFLSGGVLLFLSALSHDASHFFVLRGGGFFCA